MIRILKYMLLLMFMLTANGFITSTKYLGNEANSRLLKYNSKRKLDKVIIDRLSKSFKEDHKRSRRRLEEAFLTNIKYDGKIFKKGSIEYDIFTYDDKYGKELILYEFENKIHKYKLNNIDVLDNNPIILNGKCAFIGFYDEGIFKPYYSFVIKYPDIRQFIIRDIPMNLSLLNERWLYLENLLNLE